MRSWVALRPSLSVPPKCSYPRGHTFYCSASRAPSFPIQILSPRTFTCGSLSGRSGCQLAERSWSLLSRNSFYLRSPKVLAHAATSKRNSMQRLLCSILAPESNWPNLLLAVARDIEAAHTLQEDFRSSRPIEKRHAKITSNCVLFQPEARWD